ncbi:FUSC family protein [Kitasatospora kifunensis]|uniref:Putative membrane protein YccC n=1 Tax=Kitasatospora kifunensis TaxID=58351 RepID=A0A7W7VXF6_KITKI|nr:FUSC family protein [Kitasatospora kifunensis]MBB4926431.1 putative membrane protein YccC [Kitasatospora kifunensis]
MRTSENHDETGASAAGPGSGLLVPPAWLVRTLRPQPTPVPKAAALRAAVGMGLPVAVGAAVGQSADGALVAMGALGAVLGDTADAYRLRVFNIAVPQLFAAAGLALGEQVHGHGWAAVAALTGLALVAGMMSTIGAVSSAAGLNVLLMAVIGAGLPFPPPWWRGPGLILLGAGLILAMALLAWPARSGVPERAAVAQAYQETANLLDAAGGADWSEARARLTRALDHAYDLLLSRRALAPGRSRGMSRLIALLNAVTPLVETAPAVHAAGGHLGAQLAAEVRRIAAAVANRTPLPPPAADGASATASAGPVERAAAAAVLHAHEVLAGAYEDPAAAPVPHPAPLLVRMRERTREVLLSADSWHYGLRLALCLGLAQTLVSIVAVPRSYWVPLTVTFVLKPDFGSVFSRAVLRALGTVVGLVLAAAVLETVPRGGWEAPVVAVLAAALPVVSRRSYGLQTVVITPLILILSDLLSHQGVHLLVPRLLDSLLGCAIVLVAGYALWPESWHSRVGARLADAVDDVARYLECAFTGGGADASFASSPPGAGPPAGPSSRAKLRRRLYRDLAGLRTEFQRALGEPPPMGARAAAWWPLLVAVERVIDAGTAAAVQTAQGAQPPQPAEVAAVAADLRALATAIRGGGADIAPLREVTEGGALAAVRREVAAARSALAGPGGDPEG